MSEVDSEEVPAPARALTVGARLRQAREAAGSSLAEVAARTKIAERHIGAIEADRFADLASRTYAVGFSRTIARTLGLDEREIADAVRAQLDASDAWDAPKVAAFEPGDPARVPPSRVAWIAAIGALVAAGVVFAFWRSYYDPAVSLPDLTSEVEAAPSASIPASAAPAAVPAGGEVVFTALASGVWVKFYDAAGTQLMQKQMAAGERYVVPAGAQGPMVWTARPDALAITVGGKAVPPLSATQTTMKDVPVSAAALLARAASPQVEPSSAGLAPAAAPAPSATVRQGARLAAPVRTGSRAATRAPAPAGPPPAEPVAPAPAPAAAEPSTVSE